MEKPIIIELYEFWNTVKRRFNIVSPQPKSFNLKTSVQPVMSIDSFKLRLIDISSTDTVAHAPTTVTDVATPDEGKIWQVVAIDVQIPAPVGDTAGSHEFAIYQMGLTGGSIRPIAVEAAHSNYMRIGENDQFTGGASEQPNTGQMQQAVIHGMLWADHTNVLTCSYKNATDVDQLGLRTMKFLVREFNEGA